MLLLTLTMRSLEPRQFLYLEQREPAVLVDGPRLLEAAAPHEPVFASTTERDRGVLCAPGAHSAPRFCQGDAGERRAPSEADARAQRQTFSRPYYYAATLTNRNQYDRRLR